MDNLAKAFALFDAYNQKDPNSFTWQGTLYPQEYFLAIKLHDWIIKLATNASEELLLASRSQHIGRWEIPRNTYPGGREAYLKWRKDLGMFHAEKASAIMAEVGYDDERLERVKQIILKKKIKVDEEVQTMENALCLVFLEFQYEEFFPKHPADMVVNILRKSLLKMDSYGHSFALTLKYSDTGLSYINQALEKINNS